MVVGFCKNHKTLKWVGRICDFALLSLFLNEKERKKTARKKIEKKQDQWGKMNQGNLEFRQKSEDFRRENGESGLE